MSDPVGEPVEDRAVARTGDFERYGLVAALTLVVLCLLLADRLRPSRSVATVPPADRTLRIRLGGNIPRAPAPPARVQPAHPGPAPQRAPAESPAGERPRLALADVPPEAPRTVTVRSGDTLSEISTRVFGTSRRATEIAKLNGIDPAQIREGQTLRLPAR